MTLRKNKVNKSKPDDFDHKKECDRLRSVIKDREIELARIRISQGAAAHALDSIRQYFSLALIPSEHPADTRIRIMESIISLEKTVRHYENELERHG